MFSSQHSSDRTQLSLMPPGARFKVSGKDHTLSLFLPPLFFRSHLPSPFCSHSASQQCPVLLAPMRRFREAVKPDPMVYVHVHGVTHTHRLTMWKNTVLYTALSCTFLSSITSAHTHTHTHTAKCTQEYSQGHCSGLSEVEKYWGLLTTADTTQFVWKHHSGEKHVNIFPWRIEFGTAEMSLWGQGQALLLEKLHNSYTPGALSVLVYLCVSLSPVVTWLKAGLF